MGDSLTSLRADPPEEIGPGWDGVGLALALVAVGTAVGSVLYLYLWYGAMHYLNMIIG